MLLSNVPACSRILEIGRGVKSPEKFNRGNLSPSCLKVTPAAAFQTSAWNLVMSFVVFFYCSKLQPQLSLAPQQQAQETADKEVFQDKEDILDGIDAGFLEKFSDYVFKGTECLPHLRNRVERMMQAIQLKKAINYDVPASKLLAPLTAANAHEPFCYERLEHLGDAYLEWAVSTRLFLKFPDQSVGELTRMRSEITSNLALHQHALDKGIETYVRINPFVPGREPTDLQELSIKVLANVIEALIGTYYVEHGDKGARHVLNWLGISTDFTDAEVEHARAGGTVSDEVLQSINFEELETTLKYKFRARNLLAQALTHPSCRQAVAVPVYEQFEFLGETVLDYLLTKHIYFCYTDLPPGCLNDLRAAALNNEAFARTAVKHNLHSHIRHLVEDLDSQINSFINSGKKSVGGVKAPRTLAAILQSLVGAVYVDCGLDLDQLWKVFEPLLQPLVTPETVPMHPVRELYELCQSDMKNLEWDYSLSGEAFVAKAIVDNKVIGSGTNIAKKMAKKLAATNALAWMKKNSRTKAGSNQLQENGEFPRHILHELCDKKSWKRPDYFKHSESGPGHEKMFTCKASVYIQQLGKTQECVGQPMPSLNKAKDSAAQTLMVLLQREKLIQLLHLGCWHLVSADGQIVHKS